ERGEIAGAQAKTFETEHLDEGNEREKRDGDQRRDDHGKHYASVRSIRLPGKPSFARQRFSACAMRPLSASRGVPRRCRRPWSTRIRPSCSVEWPYSRAWARARTSEIAREPICGGGSGGAAGNERTSVA